MQRLSITIETTYPDGQEITDGQASSLAHDAATQVEEPSDDLGLPWASEPVTVSHVLRSERDECLEEEIGGILTVGQLRALLAGLPDTMHVVLATDGWYDNVATVAVPEDDASARMSYSCLTLFHGESWDSRSL